MRGIFKRLLASIMVVVMSISAASFCDLSCLKVSAGSGSGFSDYKQGDSFWFGHYPQERETSQKIINALDQMPKPVGTLLSNEQYYKYGEVSYCKLNGYWYRISQIEWQIMYVENNNNKELLLVSKKVLDFQQYNSSGKATTWEKCSLNKWLNTTFIDRAFTKTERSYIKKNIIEGASNKIFILSYADAQNPKYGFSSSTTYDDPMRRTSGTDFAVDSGSGGGMCRWILREDGVADQFHYALDGENEGCIGDCHGTVGISTSMGVRPAIRVNNMVESTGKETIFTDGVSGKVYLDFQDRYFANDSINYNHDLAKLASKFAMLGYAKKDELRTALESIGFTVEDFAGENAINLKTGHIGKGETTNEEAKKRVNYFIASRKILISNKIYNLIFAGFIGSDHNQWYSNFDPGTGETHQGFNDAKNYVLNKLDKFIKYKGYERSNTKIFITGHSRGAATANLVAADLISYNKYADKSNIYTYTFATPNTTQSPNRTEADYRRIFNIVNPEDFVTKCMPAEWGYGRYGITYTLPSKTNEGKNYKGYYDSMNELFEMYTGTSYSHYSHGEAAVYEVIKEMTRAFPDVNSMYSESYALRSGTGKKTAYEFFETSLCPVVAEGKGSFEWITGLKNMIIAWINPTTSKTYDKITTFFLKNEGAAMLADFLNEKGIDITKLELTAPVFLNYLVFYLGIGSVIYSTAKIEQLLSWAKTEGPNFSHAHMAQTYAAFLSSMSQDQIQKPRNSYKGTVNCPVDIEIYEKATGELVGRIVNNVVDETIAAKDNSVVMMVDGDSKQYWLPSDGEYEIKLIGNDNGTMDYSVSTIDENEGEIKRTNYYDVEIKEGESLEYKPNGDDIGCLTDENQNVLNADEVLEKDNFNDINISISSEGIGYAGEFIPATKGDYISLKAETDVNNSFLGWYEDDKLISTDSNYSFVAKQNRNLVAKFTNVVVDVTGITLSDDTLTLNRFGDNSFAFMKYSILPSNATTQTVVWSSSNDAVASVDESGTVIAVSPGTAVITATTVDGKHTASCNVTVKNNLGDVNDDGVINSLDALLILQISVSQIEASADMLAAADVCKDNNINSIDALMVLMYSVGEIKSFD